MKKIFLFAIAAATMATGCAKLQEIINPGDKNQPVDENDPVEIKFAANVATVEAKANGPVAEFDAAKHTIYVYGLNETNAGTKEITNAASTVTGSAVTLDKKYFYNGTTDVYSFYGYYVDDAAGVTPTPDESTHELGVTITGQQDILLATTNKETDVEGKTYADGTEVQDTEAYSAKTARAEVVPNLVFKHQLSQLNFNVRNCGTYGIILKGLDLNTVNKGTLTVAGASQGLVASTETTDKADLEVSATETQLGTVNKADSNNYTEVGTPVMVFPENEYTAILYLWQTGMEASKVRKVSVPVTIKNKADHLTEAGITGEDPGALKGYAYDVNVTVYSLEEITITASLTAWKEGEVVVFDTEDNTGSSEEEDDWNTPTPTFSIDVTEKNVATAGETFEVNVTASNAYTVNIPAEATWITETHTENVYTFTVAPGEGAERTAEIEFVSGETTLTLTVNQAAE